MCSGSISSHKKQKLSICNTHTTSNNKPWKISLHSQIFIHTSVHMNVKNYTNIDNIINCFFYNVVVAVIVVTTCCLVVDLLKLIDCLYSLELNTQKILTKLKTKIIYKNCVVGRCWHNKNQI